MSLWGRIKQGLSKTRSAIRIEKFDPELFEERLIAADFGFGAAGEIISAIEKSNDETDWKKTAKDIIYKQLLAVEKPMRYYSKPFIMMFVGINGAGKTTTIGKLAYQYDQSGRSVVIAAGDTYRAAAIDQLEIWAKLSDARLIKQDQGSDPSSVAYDACASARSKKDDIVMIDTAGRLHTNENLTKELVKMKKVIKKIDIDAPHEIVLVLDSTIGQNSLVQAKKFNEVLGITGIVVTKLDGTSKGGIILQIAKELKIPIRYIGFGEEIEDLKAFDAKQFAEAII